MKRQAFALLFLGIFVALDAAALKIEPPPMPMERGSLYSTAPAPASAMREGSFDVNLVITDAKDGLSRWLAMTPKQRDRISREQHFRPNQKGYVAVVLTNYRAPEANVDLTAQVSLVGPDGKVVYEHRDLGRSAWGHPLQGYLAIRPDIDFSFDGSDVAGTYTYRVVVSDHIKGEIGRAEQKLVFVK
jgi:hypothetical protein